MKALCIGHAAYDVTFLLDTFLKENTKTRVNQKVECGGGPANNAAYLLGKYGIETYFMGLVGNDFYGNKIEKELKEVNVNTKYLIKKDNYETTVSTIVANKSNGSRTILTYRNNDIAYPLVEIDFTPDIILVDGQEIEISRKLIRQFNNAISVIDAGRATPEIVELSKEVKYLICSKEFAEKVTNMIIDFNNKETLVNIYKKMKEIFNNTIVITLEENGCLYMEEEFIKIMPSLKVKPLDTTGAGDFFHGAFVYSLIKGYKFEEALKLSNIVGALSVTKVGSKNSVPLKEEVKKFYDKFE